MFRFNPVVWLLVPLVTLALAGCDQKKGLSTGGPAPPFAVADIAGRPVSLNSAQDRMLILYFWKDSCCGDRLKAFQAPYQARQGQVELVAVNAGDAREVVTAYAANNRLTFRLVADEGCELVKAFDVFGFPTIYIIDRHGVIRERVLGDVQPAQVMRLVQRHLDRQTQAAQAYRDLHRPQSPTRGQ